MYTVYPIKSGVIESPITKGGLTYLHDDELPVPIPVITFLITADDPDDDTVIFVDTGVEQHDPGETIAGGRTIRNGGREPIVDGLAKRGLEPGDVDYVVLTHLHYDHASNNDLFPDAEFVVQRSELEFARDPLPIMERTFFDEHVEVLDDVETRIVDGDHQLREGIELLHTPGHTPGMQSIVVETSDGPVCIISDLAYCKHNLDPGASSMLDGHGNKVEITPSDLDYIAPGLHVDVGGCYESIDRIRNRVGNGTLLGGHVTEILDRSYPDT